MQKDEPIKLENLARRVEIATPAELARVTGLSRPTCSELWHGKNARDRSSRVLQRLSEALGDDVTMTEVVEALENTGAM